MKGIVVWMWLIAGVLMGMIMFALFFQLMSYLTISKAREDAKQSFDELTGTINSMCESKAGLQSTKSFAFPDSVSIVYSTGDPKIYSEKNNRTYGTFACLKFQKEQFCEGLRCNAEFHPIRSSQNVLGLVDTILGKSSSHEYLLKLTKTECGVSVLNSGETPSASCGGTINPPSVCTMTSLIRCQGNVILGLPNPQILVLTDMSRFLDCCNGNDKIITLLDNTAKYFGGKNILIVWELDSYDPTKTNLLPIKNSLNSLGFNVYQVRHSSLLTQDILNNYDQLWLYRPGWCSPNIAGCSQTIPWDDSEINAIGNFVAGSGKLFLLTDTSAGNVEDQVVVNKILKITKTTSFVDGATVCGIGDQIITTSDITKSVITKDLSTFDVTAATRLKC